MFLRCSQSPKCVTSLQHLEVVNSHIIGFAPTGLSACHALRQLHCMRGCITADATDDTLEARSNIHCMIPSTLSALTSLTKLHLLVCGGDQFPGVQVSRLYSLEALQHLQLRSEGKMCITSGLSALNRLTHLLLEVTSRFPDDPATGLQLHVDDWTSMQDLQHVVIRSETVVYSEGILTLAKMQQLKSIKLVGFSPDNVGQNLLSVKTFARLVYLLAKYCPGVDVCVDGTWIADS